MPRAVVVLVCMAVAAPVGAVPAALPLAASPLLSQGAAAGSLAAAMQPANYADVRERVAFAYAEKAHEMAEATRLLQTLSKQTQSLLAEAAAICA